MNFIVVRSHRGQVLLHSLANQLLGFFEGESQGNTSGRSGTNAPQPLLDFSKTTAYRVILTMAALRRFEQPSIFFQKLHDVANFMKHSVRDYFTHTVVTADPVNF
jgi:hypothetical protein